MAGLCMKGHVALASVPVSGKVKGLHSISSSLSSLHIFITAKASAKLEIRKSGPKSKSSSAKKAGAKGKQVKVSSKSRTEREVKSAGKPGTKSNARAGSLKNTGQLDLEEPILAMDGYVLKRDTSRAGENAFVLTKADEHAEAEDAEVDDGLLKNKETSLLLENEETDEEASGEEFETDLDEPEGLGEDIELFTPPGVVVSEEKKLQRLPGSNILLGPYANNSRVKQAEFVKSSPCVAECPAMKLPEFAMVGRSNVGKSSLINALVQRKNLAQTSKKPGKTQLINHFIINNSWYLVDLPGYGYAKVPASIRTSWDAFTKDFFLNSKTLVCVMLLVDGSIPPQQVDLEYTAWLRQNKVPLTIVFTKCDRRKKKKNEGRRPVENVRDFLKSLKKQFDQLPPWIMTSCVTHQGKDELLMHMSQLRNYWNC